MSEQIGEGKPRVRFFARADDNGVRKEHEAFINGPNESFESVEERDGSVHTVRRPGVSVVTAAEFKENGNRRDITKPGETHYEPGIVDATVEGKGGKPIKREHPYVNLMVNFGTPGKPNWCPVTGVRLFEHLRNNATAPYYAPIGGAPARGTQAAATDAGTPNNAPAGEPAGDPPAETAAHKKAREKDEKAAAMKAKREADKLAKKNNK